MEKKFEFNIKSLPNEIWKDIPSYEGLYQVSNMGRVKSFNRFKNGIILHQAINPQGYPIVVLSKQKNPKTITVHKLVASTFLKKESKECQIDHINTIRTDNRVENLRWCTPKENSNNPITLKKHKQAHLFSIEKIAKIRRKPIIMCSLNNEFIREFESSQKVNKELGFDASNIRKCCHLGCAMYGYIWKFK